MFITTAKAGNTEQEISHCSISAHAQTLNKYPDAKNTFGYQNNERIFVAALQSILVFKRSIGIGPFYIKPVKFGRAFMEICGPPVD